MLEIILKIKPLSCITLVAGSAWNSWHMITQLRKVFWINFIIFHCLIDLTWTELSRAIANHTSASRSDITVTLRNIAQLARHIGEYVYLITHYPFRTKSPGKYLFPGGNRPLLYHQIGNIDFFIFITHQWNLMFCVDKIKYEHLAILSNLKVANLHLK